MLREWIGTEAAALAITVLALAALLVWGVRRRKASGRRPIIGCIPARAADGSIILHVAVRNRLPEPIEVAKVRLLRPRGAVLANGRAQGAGAAPVDDARGAAASEIALHHEVAAAGVELTTRFQELLPGFSNTGRFDLRLRPPKGWSAGEVRLALRIATVSAPIRRTWITVRSRVDRKTALENDEAGAEP